MLHARFEKIAGINELDAIFDNLCKLSRVLIWLINFFSKKNTQNKKLRKLRFLSDFRKPVYFEDLENTEVVYILASLTHPKYFYNGLTKNWFRRMFEHFGLQKKEYVHTIL